MILKRSKLLHKVAVILLLLPVPLAAQPTPIEDALFWEVSGNDLQHPSYLFGTFHLLGASYVDSLQNVIDKFSLCNAVAGEILFDSSMIGKMMLASIMKDTTLQMVLSPEIYERTNDWLGELSEYNLSILNRINPATIQMMLMNLVQQQIYGTVAEPMDLYLQRMARVDGKKVVGLETIEDQLSALYGTPYKRQAEVLTEFVLKKDLAGEEMKRMNTLYRQQKLSLLSVVLSDSFTEEEKKVLLDLRNERWMKVIPEMIREQSTFVTVGALHLTGETGLVNQLRRAGYNVTPLPLN
jgi:uncharacterized protein